MDGACEGDIDGIVDGACEGDIDGIADWDIDGITDGACDGDIDCILDGTNDTDDIPDGDRDGKDDRDGIDVGASVGLNDGPSLGILVGYLVGVFDVSIDTDDGNGAAVHVPTSCTFKNANLGSPFTTDTPSTIKLYLLIVSSLFSPQHIPSPPESNNSNL